MTSKAKPKFRSAYSPAVSVTLETPDETMTKQAFKDECDINNIVNKYQKTGIVTHVQQRQPSYGYAPSADFQTAVNLVHQQREQFAHLPSEIRAKFDNDPLKLLEYVETNGNGALSALLERSTQTRDPSRRETQKLPTAAEKAAEENSPPEATPGE